MGEARRGEARSKKPETRNQKPEARNKVEEGGVREVRTAMILSLLIVGSTIAQTGNVTSSGGTRQTWQIPFAPTDNTISLSVQNNSSLEAKNVSVTFESLPPWLEFKSNTVLLKSIAANGTAEAEFTFSADRNAPVGQNTTLTATISSADGQTWTKEISVAIGAPKDYKPYNNFPNPFNPTTTIRFDLKQASTVTMEIYNALGQKIQEWNYGMMNAGRYGENINMAQFVSGTYFYRIVVQGNDGDRFTAIKKLMLVK